MSEPLPATHHGAPASPPLRRSGLAQASIALSWIGAGLILGPGLLIIAFLIGTAGSEALGWAMLIMLILFVRILAPITLALFVAALICAVLARRAQRSATGSVHRPLGLTVVVCSALGAAASLAAVILGVQVIG